MTQMAIMTVWRTTNTQQLMRKSFPFARTQSVNIKIVKSRHKNDGKTPKMKWLAVVKAKSVLYSDLPIGADLIVNKLNDSLN